MNIKKLGIVGGIVLGLCSITVQAADQPENHCIEITYEEAQDLLKVAAHEAAGEGWFGQFLVMSCIMNRVEDPDWPNTIHEVCTQSGQFAYDVEGQKPNADTHLALAKIEMGFIAPEIIGFEASKSTVLDQYFTEKYCFKNHKFYIKKED